MGASIPVETIAREVLEKEFDVPVWRSESTDNGLAFYATLDDLVDYESRKQNVHMMITNRLLALDDVNVVSVQSKMVRGDTNTVRVEVSVD